ncbi:hypothetical protein RTM1035_01345 [Roseovarius sp. TM1035]|nr:hypothetical protein RTM1035_01345 [Roseovarius sp. TM1035]
MFRLKSERTSILKLAVFLINLHL